MALTGLTSCNGLGIAGLWNSEDELEYIPVSEDGERWGFLGRDHKVVLADEFKHKPSAVVNGHFSVREGKGYALYKFSGKRPEVVKGCDNLECVGVFRGGLAPVTKKGKRISVINPQGETRFELNPVGGKEIKVCALGFTDGRLMVINEDGKMGFVDEKGNYVVRPTYDDANPFNEGVAIVAREKDNGKRYSVINEAGEVIFNMRDSYRPIKDDVGDALGGSLMYNGGYIFVRDDDRILAIDKKGESRKMSSKVKDVHDWDDEYIVFSNESGEQGVIDYDGERIVSPKYERIQIIGNDDFLCVDDDKARIVNGKGETTATIDISDGKCICLDPAIGIAAQEKSSVNFYKLNGERVCDTDFKDLDILASACSVVYSDKDNKGGSDMVSEDDVYAVTPAEDTVVAAVETVEADSYGGSSDFPQATGVIVSGTSEEAYNSYPTEVTDYSIGDNWGDSDAVLNARSRSGYKTFYGSGTISNHAVQVYGVIDNNGHVLGRYYNENGIKLDMNGLIDYNKDMVIKLGHGSETSYWILMHQGNGRYVGTWGKKCKPSEVTFTFS